MPLQQSLKWHAGFIQFNLTVVQVVHLCGTAMFASDAVLLVK